MPEFCAFVGHGRWLLNASVACGTSPLEIITQRPISALASFASGGRGWGQWTINSINEINSRIAKIKLALYNPRPPSSRAVVPPFTTPQLRLSATSHSTDHNGRQQFRPDRWRRAGAPSVPVGNAASKRRRRRGTRRFPLIIMIILLIDSS